MPTETMVRPTCTLLFVLVFVIGASWTSPVQAQDALEDPDIVLEVNGMSCPFCAFGIEKKLKKLDGVDQLTVHLEAGTVEMKLEDGATLSEERLRKAITDAGFTPGTITFINEEARASAPTGR